MIQTTFAASRLDAGMYDPNFLTVQEADELFAFLQTLPRSRPVNPLNSGSFLRRTTAGSWNDFGTRRGKNSVTKTLLTMDDAPWPVKNLAVQLSLHAGNPVNYIAAIGYENEKDHIDWHQHGEDRARDARVFIVSLGATRTFGLREICPDCRVCVECNEAACDGHKRECDECRTAKMHKSTCPVTRDSQRWALFEPTHGSLITLPSDYNWTHEHAVLDDASPKSLRISLNTKCLPTDETLEDFITRMERATEPKAITTVWHCQKHPYDVYIGRRMFRFGLPESDFANRSDGDYESWLLEKLKDPAFADKVKSLRGNRLGCWCRDRNDRDFSKCHGHILARYADAST